MSLGSFPLKLPAGAWRPNNRPLLNALVGETTVTTVLPDFDPFGEAETAPRPVPDHIRKFLLGKGRSIVAEKLDPGGARRKDHAAGNAVSATSSKTDTSSQPPDKPLDRELIMSFVLETTASEIRELNLKQRGIASPVVKPGVSLDWAKDFSRLRTLDLGENSVNITELVMLPFPSVRVIVLACNGIQEFEVAQNAPVAATLQALDVSYNQITPQSIVHLARMVHLKVVNLSSNSLDELPGQMFMLKSLAVLSLERNNLFLDDTFKLLAEMPQLKELNLAANRLSRVCELPRDAFPNLQFLDLSGNLFVDPTALAPLVAAPVLETIILHGNPFVHQFKDGGQSLLDSVFGSNSSIGLFLHKKKMEQPRKKDSTIVPTGIPEKLFALTPQMLALSGTRHDWISQPLSTDRDSQARAQRAAAAAAASGPSATVVDMSGGFFLTQGEELAYDPFQEPVPQDQLDWFKFQYKLRYDREYEAHFLRPPHPTLISAALESKLASLCGFSPSALQLGAEEIPPSRDIRTYYAALKNALQTSTNSQVNVLRDFQKRNRVLTKTSALADGGSTARSSGTTAAKKGQGEAKPPPGTVSIERLGEIIQQMRDRIVALETPEPVGIDSAAGRAAEPWKRDMKRTLRQARKDIDAAVNRGKAARAKHGKESSAGSKKPGGGRLSSAAGEYDDGNSALNDDDEDRDRDDDGEDDDDALETDSMREFDRKSWKLDDVDYEDSETIALKKQLGYINDEEPEPESQQLSSKGETDAGAVDPTELTENLMLRPEAEDALLDPLVGPDFEADWKSEIEQIKTEISSRLNL